MTLPQRFWQYARPVTVAFLLAAVLYSALVVKQPAATTNRLHSRQLGLYTHTNASYARDLGHSQYLYTRDTDYTGWPALTAASDDDYAVAKKRGELLLCWLDNPEEVPPEKGTSPWNNYDDLETWGWEDKSRDWTGGERDPGLKDIFDNSEINRDAKGDKKAVFEHTREHPAEGGQRYPATGAKYENYVYPRHGLLVAEYNYGPDRRIESLIRKGTWDTSTMSKPKLFQLSDVMWLGWAKYTTDDNRSNLQIMAVHQVGNDPTKAMMAKIMKATVPSKGPMFLGRAPQ
ncbi:uncharacterized protein CLAFUR5_05984 [Fulvia fulva]|uniref:Uncharacterized protein n=1 Tax=Passalora fulva TaxID=5499 RepID=A0A9Q8LH42_PASFU|nr:uncharacterized protein CLAFUR5_05984 [Fulvia fulva]KAK4625739.1 hypothetical protein CLAFUR0_05848 [Fulvia fulva]UJO17375.1 hypothetical protein CLAFUR5_05984 [Fulvia fulva]